MRPHPVYAYLVRTDANQTILIDSGNPRCLVGKPTAAPWFDAPIAMRPDHDLVAQLARHGLNADDIDLLVSTHFDFDHCGNHDLFHGGVVSLVHADALEAARQDSGRFDPALWDIPGLTYSPFNGDLDLAPGLQLLHTPGHAAGHLSVFIETESGPLILAIDALADSAAIRHDPLPSFYVEDELAWETSRTRLLALAREGNAVLIPGHEPLEKLEY